jgi:hypothetical protein
MNMTPNSEIACPRQSRRGARAVQTWVLLVLGCWAWGGAALAQPAYPKIEASFTLSGLTGNPFDYTQNNVLVSISQPDGSVATLPAFFDGGTTWRVRHTPAMMGVFTITNITLNGQTIAAGNLQPSFWLVAGPPIGPGFVRIDPNNPRRFATSDGERYFPVGHDAAWDYNSLTGTVVTIMGKMGGTRENWSRIWMDDWDGKNLDWPAPGALGYLNLTVARKWDAIVAAADQAGIHFQMTLQHHGQYSSTVDPEWSYNPYNSAYANGYYTGFLGDATQFFTNATAIAVTQLKFRYAVARWGYSPSIMAWELFNEVQFTDAGQDNEWTNIESWHNLMATFLRSQDRYHHLVTTSSDLTEPIWDETDYYTHHDYPADLIDSIANPPNILPTQPVAPVFGSECGVNFTPHLGETPALFAGLMAGQSAAEQIWYWDFIDTNGDYVPMSAGSDFVAFSGLGRQNGLTASAPEVTCSQNGPLVLGLGGGWSTATQSVFTVGQTAPAALGSAPTYLQGYYHRSMTPDGYTFLVDYPAAGTFAVQVVQTALSGAGLTILLDDVTETNVSFPSSTNGDITTNVTFTIDVPAGEHSIWMTNGGLDWINLGSLTLDPYAPLIGAYGLANSQFAALWFWHHTNVYYPAATSAVAAQTSLTGLQAGSYSGVWWDPAAGAVLSNITFTVTGPSQSNIITSPPILRSAAFYAGLPARAQVGASALAETLGTNAPPVTLPVTITNSGGLPLAWSLSVTNAAPVAYSALTSLQTGGPQYAWKDISGIGVDLRTNLTATTGKSALDEGIAGPVNLGFGFPFFSGGQSPGVYSQIYVSPDGFITFTPFSGDQSSPKTLPNPLAPTNCVALYWCDLTLSTKATNHIYAAADPVAHTFTVQFQNVTPKTGGGFLTGQIILKSTGEIVLQYQSIGNQGSVIVGVQNAAATHGLNVASTASALQTNYAIILSPTPWVRAFPTAGLLAAAAATNVGVSFNSAGLAPGAYSAALVVNTSDSTLPPATLPLNLTVSAALPAAPSWLAAGAVTWSHVTLTWTNNAGNATGFAILRATAPGGPFAQVGAAAANATSFTDTTATSQTAYYYEVVATNASGYSLDSAAAGAVTTLAPIDLWRLANFGTTVNAGEAADGADPEDDGLPNIVKYAFDLDPLAPSPYPLSVAMVNGQLTVQFQRTDPPPLDIDYIMQTTASLNPPLWTAASTSQSARSNGDGTETVTETVNNSSQGYFLLVSVARQ